MVNILKNINRYKKTCFSNFSKFDNRSSSRMNSSDCSDKIIDRKNIRNFSIVAHVDHGKSTLADRLLEITGAIKPGSENAQVLDQLPVEKERGITVKAVTASLNYTYDNKSYLLNLIDTPGHVDFSNEVVRSVTACQGVILLVDANEGEEPIDKAVAGQVIMVGLGPKGGGSVGDLLLSIDAPETVKNSSMQAVKHMVYAGIFPADQSQHVFLSDAIKKLVLNDSAVSISIDSSPALGQGWRVGFLGLLHLDVFTQRLLQEHKAEAILTAPSVPYKIKLKGSKIIKKYGSEEIIITNPLQLPDSQHIEEYYEPLVIGTIITPVEYIGAVTTLCIDRRGIPLPSNAIDDKMTLMQFILPLSEVVIDFHDTLKSITSGFASFDYEDHGFHPSHLVRMDIQLNGTVVDELCCIVHKSRLEYAARRLTEKLKEMIPRQMVQVAIQAVVSGRVYARETIKAYRKDVTAKLYGGDVTRRKKLLKQQAEGKKKMRSVANIKIPRDTFIDVLKK
ncbi:unnamed protein product, partial [Iphiclides podalirius]